MYRFKMLVRALMSIGPSCFRCLHEMPSGPTEEVSFHGSIACFVMFWGERRKVVVLLELFALYPVFLLVGGVVW